MKYIIILKVVSDKDLETVRNDVSNAFGDLIESSAEMSAEMYQVNES